MIMYCHYCPGVLPYHSPSPTPPPPHPSHRGRFIPRAQTNTLLSSHVLVQPILDKYYTVSKVTIANCDFIQGLWHLEI
jgi:hypothetical protein